MQSATHLMNYDEEHSVDYDCPILLIAWKRPYCIQRVINVLRRLRPLKVYVSCDGPNKDNPEEVKSVNETRKLIEKEIDWPCQLKLNYYNTNLGCKEGVSKGIDWFFHNEEAGIILEDDCVPHIDFFEYCRTLLDRYRYDTRIWCISGVNFQSGQWRGDGSYYFSRYNHCWGWASWRRCWIKYDRELVLWPTIIDSNLLSTIFENPLERRYWCNIWNKLYKHGVPNTWDYQWTLTCLINGGLTAIPNKNLIANIGFGDINATHTTAKAERAQITHLGEGLSEIKEPSILVRDQMADQYTFDFHYGGRNMRLPLILIVLAIKVFNKIKGEFVCSLDKIRSKVN